MLSVGLLLLWWITRKAGGFGPVLSAPSKFTTPGEFVRFFIPSLTAMVGFWATVALNIPDFTRYAASQKAQVVGQALKGVFPVATGLIVDGFASPRILVEIDVDAVVQDGPQARLANGQNV